MNQLKKLWNPKNIRIVRNWIAEKNWKQIFIKLSIIATGIFLMAEFLVSMRWARSTSYYDEELQQTVFTMKIGFHWTTLLGMLGCIIIVLGILSLCRIKQYRMSGISLVAFLINFGAWDFFWDMSEHYFFFELENPMPLIKLHCILKFSSYVIAVILLFFIFKRKKGKLMKSIQGILAVLLIIVTFNDLFLKTVTNRWFLYQAIGAVLLTAVLCFGTKVLENNVVEDVEEVKRKQILAVTGDTHGDASRFLDEDSIINTALCAGDYLFVCGDFGFLFRNDNDERKILKRIAEKAYTICFVDGNHENFDLLESYPVELWNGGKVHVIIRDSNGIPKIIHLMRGQMFEIAEKKIFTFGGGNSIDKYIRKESVSWWPQEMPTEDEEREAIETLEKYDYQCDYILTHAAPEDTMTICHPYHDDEKSLNNFLEYIRENTIYSHWYFGHLHRDEDFWRHQTGLWLAVINMETNVELWKEKKHLVEN